MCYFGVLAAKSSVLRDHEADRRRVDMRHLIGTGLAVVLSAMVFFGGTWGYYRLVLRNGPGSAWSLPSGGGGLASNSTVMLGLGAVVGVALIAGLLAVIPRISPLATGLPGLALLAWTVLYLVVPRQAVHGIPLKSHSFGMGFAALGTTGILGAAGIVLVMPLFMPSRWRRLEGDDDWDDDVLEATSVTTPSRSGPSTGSWKTISIEPTRPVVGPGDAEGW
jgi:hypothetical protein